MKSAKVGVTRTNCALALLLLARVAAAQNPPVAAAPTAAAPTTSAASTPETTPGGLLKMSYEGGQLRIDALNSTLGDVLTRVAALTRVKIEIPPGASSERLPVVKLGPGPAREILASLLGGSSFDYLILASPADPGGIQDVMLMPREKDSGSKAPDPVMRASRTPDPRVTVAPSASNEPPESSSPAAAQTDNPDAQTTPAPTQSDQPTPSSPMQSDQPALSPATLSNRSGLTTEGAMSPPAELNSSTINQQLQQMYQQRMQMTQQSRQSAQPPAPANPESK